MATQQTQFYKAGLKIGAVTYPALPGMRISVPKNFAVPPIIGNYWQLNYVEGMRQPMVECNLVARDVAGEVASAALFDLFHTRTADVAHDTVPIPGGISFWDGTSGWLLNGAKADSYTISASKGEDIAISMRFVGTTIAALGAAINPGWSSNPPLRFQNLVFGNQLADIPWMFSLSFSNNHHPDMSLNGSVFPAACNAGMMTAGLNVRVQAQDVVPNGGPTSIAIIGHGTSQDTPNGATYLTFTLPNIALSTPDDKQVEVPRVMRAYQYICLGGDSQATPPLSVA